MFIADAVNVAHPLFGSLQDFLRVLPEFLVRAGVSVFCGALVGLERERRGKPAGFRTNILICLGAAIYMQIGELVLISGAPGMSDPTRIAAQVVTGIGFLGAGTIMQSGGSIIGLTSAATIWVVAAIGLMIGAGFPMLGLVCTGMTLLTLSGLTRMERVLLGRCEYVPIDVVFAAKLPRAVVEAHVILVEQDVERKQYEFHKQPDGRVTLRVRYCERHPSHQRFLAPLLRVPGVVEVHLRGVTAGE